MNDSRETSTPTQSAPSPASPASRAVVGVRRLKEPFEKPTQTRIFSVSNQKGGVGKTTTTVNIAAALAMGGLRTLVIDLDPQGNASTALGVPHLANNGIYEVLMGTATIDSVVQKVAGFPHLECISSNTALAQAEINLVSIVARELRLKEAIAELTQSRAAQDLAYDYILIDCPPSLGLLTVNALAAARELLIPIQCEYYALEGLTQLLETYSVVKKRLNPDLKLSTIVLTMFDGRTRLANDVADSVRSHFPHELIDIPVPRAVRISEAPSYGQTVMTYDPMSPGALAYMQIAKEIADRGKGFNSNVVNINYKKGESA
ncbi:MAG: ParA family protein [Actinobacteria bacterium]|nr:ParA family protein [Actinomycetota bacterium]